MNRRILSAFAALGVSLWLFVTQSSAKVDPVFGQIDSIVKSLSSITGLEEKHPVPYGRMDRHHLRQFLNKRIKKTLKPEEIQADELALKMFGFVPQDFDLRKSTMDLLTEQAAAFYDYEEKKLFLMQESSVSSETMTLAHELSHALADQHFNLEDFMDEKPSSDDENLAHSAVVEGEASWLMIAYSLKQAGQDPTPTPEMLRSVVESDSSSTADYPVLSDAPLYIKESLLFPYAQGTAFFDAVYKKLGKRAFAAVFADPPVTSSQIMHPDRYFLHEQPAHPALPEVPGAREQEEITEGSVGEFDHQMLIRQYVGAAKAAELAPHLRGGQFKVWSAGKSARPVLQYSSEWDSPELAGSFFAIYPKILTGKWSHCDIAVHTPVLLAGSGDSGMFVTRLTGKMVWSVEGLSDVKSWQRLQIAR